MKFYDIYEFEGVGYEKLFHHQDWRVAILNYIEELEVEHINYFEAHTLTDEVFVLLSGKCYMFFIEEENQEIKNISCISLKPNKVYRIPKGVYHAHTLTKEAKLLIVEEENTCYDNSPRIYLDEADRKLLMNKFKEMCREV